MVFFLQTIKILSKRTYVDLDLGYRYYCRSVSGCIMSGHKVTNPLINSVPPPMSSAPTLMRPGILKPPSVLLGTEFGGPGSGGQGNSLKGIDNKTVRICFLNFFIYQLLYDFIITVALR
jgi:hypothetical protein